MNRRRLQFSIRALLLIVAIVSVPLFWLAKIFDRTRRQEAAIQEVARREGIVGQGGGNAWVPEWFRVAVGEEFFRSPKSVDFATNLGRRFGSNEAKAIDEDLILCEELILSDTDISDEGLIHLHGLSTLNQVVLDDTRTTRTGISRLREALANW